MAAYIPREDSLANKVLTFLHRNPDEMLSAEDILIKFDEPMQRSQAVYQRLRAAMSAGLLARRPVDGVHVYLLPSNPTDRTTLSP